mmetsp:Transcript_45202/g.54417  ORF Transcript_45202/g.54417 Transcript_45202/m.54417 type:complete len:148 (-) Transcript_45202:16-459(-)
MPDHNPVNIAISKNGTDPLDCTDASNVLKIRKNPKHIPGKNTAVTNVQSCHRRPRNDLYSIAEVYPAKVPLKAYSRSSALRSDPRRAGDRHPTAERPIVEPVAMAICTPEPQNTQKSMGYVVGGRKTSACITFHPMASSSNDDTPCP